MQTGKCKAIPVNVASANTLLTLLVGVALEDGEGIVEVKV